MPGRQDYGKVMMRAVEDPRVHAAAAAYIKAGIARRDTAVATVCGHLALLGGYLASVGDDGRIGPDPAFTLARATGTPGASAAKAAAALREADLLTEDGGGLRLRGWRDLYSPLVEKRERDRLRKEAQSRGSRADIHATESMRSRGSRAAVATQRRREEKRGEENPPGSPPFAEPGPAKAPEPEPAAPPTTDPPPDRFPRLATTGSPAWDLDLRTRHRLDGRAGFPLRVWLDAIRSAIEAGATRPQVEAALTAASPLLGPQEALRPVRDALAPRPPGRDFDAERNASGAAAAARRHADGLEASRRREATRVADFARTFAGKPQEALDEALAGHRRRYGETTPERALDSFEAAVRDEVARLRATPPPPPASVPAGEGEAEALGGAA